APTGRGPMKTQGFERRFSQNLAPVSREKPQNLYFAYISNLFSKPYLSIRETLYITSYAIKKATKKRHFHNII
ncbi:hypothetical protein, partial [Microcystis sp. M061S2]|uniref:hypothetical protein n=1 Tax=Microcystis sp. M061S2 TaxID=2771171 RepID=UPI00258D7CB8